MAQKDYSNWRNWPAYMTYGGKRYMSDKHIYTLMGPINRNRRYMKEIGIQSRVARRTSGGKTYYQIYYRRAPKNRKLTREMEAAIKKYKK